MRITLKAIDARIAKVAKLGSEYNVFIHDTACMILAHAAGAGAGDVSRVTTLLAAMPNSMRKTAMRRWLTLYSPVALDGGKDGKPFSARLSEAYKAIKDDAKKAAAWKLADAAANPFYTIADAVPEEKEYSLAALVKMIQGYGKRIDAKIEKGEVPANDVEAARKLARQVEGFAFAA